MLILIDLSTERRLPLICAADDAKEGGDDCSTSDQTTGGGMTGRESRGDQRGRLDDAIIGG